MGRTSLNLSVDRELKRLMKPECAKDEIDVSEVTEELYRGYLKSKGVRIEEAPHPINPEADPDDPSAWQALCGRHQVIKKNFWDNASGKLNVYAIVQAAPAKVKREVFEFLKKYFGE